MGDINDAIRPGRKYGPKVSTSDDASFGAAEKNLLQTLEAQKKKYDDDRRIREQLAVKQQASEMLKFERAGVKITVTERIKALKDFAKQQKTQEMKDLIEYHKKSAEIQKEYNKTVLAADSGASIGERLKAIGQETKANIKEKISLAGVMTSAKKLFDNLSQEFNGIMSEYAKYQIGINTRLQDSGKSYNNMTKLLKDTVGVTPYVKTQTMVENLNKLTELGIVHNLEQRAFLETLADNISTTFDATNASLLRLVRLQQSDSTAARLGLETSLTKYLNRMYEDSSYLNTNFDNVSTALLEATSQMTNEATIQFEYIVQRWLGSLSSVGLSDSTVTNLATAIGHLGSGNIAGLESMSGMRNLLVMASSRSGNLNYADMLSKGIDASQTNDLLQSVVEYIQEIASTDNKVIQSQYANLFGISMSDMTAAKNLANNLSDISEGTLSYSEAIAELQGSMKTMSSRMSVATIMDNLWSNLQYGLATNIAESPAMYGLWKATDMIQGLTGGINIPFVSAVGTGVDINTTVENLMKLGLIVSSSFGMMDSLISGISNTGNPLGMLTKLGIGTSAGSTTRGSGIDFKRISGGVDATFSRSTLIGSGSSEDIQASTLKEAQNNVQKELKNKQDEMVDYTKLNSETSKSTLDYFQNVFDRKIDSMIGLMTKVATYNLKNGSGEFDSSTLDAIVLGGTTGVVVSEAQDSDKRLSTISSIDSTIKQILQQLQSGINVRVEENGSPSSLY